MSGPVTFPTGLVFTGPNTQKPFSTAGLFATATTSGQALFGGSPGSPPHKLVPAINGRRRIAFAFG